MCSEEIPMSSHDGTTSGSFSPEHRLLSGELCFENVKSLSEDVSDLTRRYRI